MYYTCKYYIYIHVRTCIYCTCSSSLMYTCTVCPNYTCMYTYIYMYSVCTCTYVHCTICTTCTCTYMYIQMYMYMYVHTCTFVYMRVHVLRNINVIHVRTYRRWAGCCRSYPRQESAENSTGPVEILLPSLHEGTGGGTDRR